VDVSDPAGPDQRHAGIAQQDYWATFYKIVEQKVAEGQLFDHPIAKDATERLQHEKPLGDS